MPLVIVTGLPCSGKTTRAIEIKKYFEEEHKKTVRIVSEDNLIQASGLNKNDVFNDSTKEKAIRGQVKSEAIRFLGKEEIVIIDAGNYIKGFRYELYCASKAARTPQCTVQPAVAADEAGRWDSARPPALRYSPGLLAALAQRFEAPEPDHRWDAPLFAVRPAEPLPGPALAHALLGTAPPPPNQSTQCPPLSSASYLYELDRLTQDIVTAVLQAQRQGAEGRVPVPGCAEPLDLTGAGLLAPAQLGRLRRQFLAYSKLHPVTDAARAGPLFVQFINSSLQR